MNRLLKRYICVILAVVLAVGMAPFSVSAQSNRYDKSSGINFNKSYFKQSSYTYNIELAKLSVQAALASISYFDPGKDPRQTEPSQNARNLKNMLIDKGFKDVKANKYFSVEELENSIGVAVGRMPIRQDGKTYTLLAVVPRSINYKQEWAGNFEIGGGNIHTGFKAARDEVVRCLKKYIRDNKISGDLKVWISGHSRGAAVSNMVGGFLAGGGNAYFGKNVRIRPENIYCYCFAVPCLIKNGASKSEELSVAGAQGGRYANNTDGASFTYKGKGTLNTKAGIYKGIKNYLQYEDIVTKLPSEKWKLTFYGNAEPAYGKISWKQMLTQLKSIHPGVYREYSSANLADFKYCKFDLGSLQIIPDSKKRNGSLKTFLDERANTLNKVSPSNKYYKESGYQDALVALGGIYGMLLCVNTDYEFGDQIVSTSSLIKPLLLTYLSFVSDRIKEDSASKGVMINDAQAVGIWLGDFAKYISGIDVPQDPTFDYLLLAFTEFVANNRNSKLVNTIVEKVAGDLSESDRQVLLAFTPVSKWKNTSNEEAIKNALIACARGPASSTPARLAMKNAAEVRSKFYEPLTNMLGEYPELAAAINNGSGSLTEIANALIRMIISPGMTLGEAADAELTGQFKDILCHAAEKAQELYGASYPDYYTDAMRHISTAMDHITQIRQIVSYMLFFTPGDNSVETTLSNACTFVSALDALSPAHRCESYAAWIFAREKAEKILQYLEVTISDKKVRKKALKKKAKAFSVIKAAGAKGKLSYKKVSGSSRLTVMKKGKIKVRKATKKGTYRIKVKVTAAGTARYKPATKIVTVKIRVK